jgi:hypothetical protein
MVRAGLTIIAVALMALMAPGVPGVKPWRDVSRAAAACCRRTRPGRCRKDPVHVVRQPGYNYRAFAQDALGRSP